MTRVIDRPQVSDMGSGFGHYEGLTGVTLGDFLTEYKKNTGMWGMITIFERDGKVLRKFDYTYDREEKHLWWLLRLSWELDLKIKEVKFDYCFMSEDVEIYLE